MPKKSSIISIERQSLGEEVKQTKWFIINTWATIVTGAAGVIIAVVEMSKALK